MRTASELAEIFSELATLLELKGANSFKIRAFEQAARTLESTSASLEDLRANPPAGFGKGLLEKLEEFLRTGQIHEHLELAEKTPHGLFDLLRIQGLGPKKVKLLYETLGIDSVDALEHAVQKNALLEVKGFGAKTQANILEGIRFLRTSIGKFLLAEAEVVAGDVMRHLQERFPDVPLAVAGSVRRRKEVVKDIDILAGSDGAREIMAAFVGSPLVQRVLSEGDTKSSIITQSGLQADLRVVPPESLGTALCHFTGSKEHNTRMRSLAVSQGKKLNEYGLYEGDTTLAYVSEEEVFAALGLQFIPPELREDMGEIDWAQKQAVPRLVEETDIRGLLHVHTVASDGHATLEQIADTAASLGLEWVGICDHSRSAHYARGLSVEAVREQWRQIDEVNRRKPGVTLFKGIESDINPDGTLDYPDDILAGFDFVIGSIHSHFSTNPDETTRRLVTAMGNPALDILGHISGRVLLERDGYALHWDEVLDACVARQVVVEINANPRRLDIDWRHIRAGLARPLCYSIGVDAHDLRGLSDSRFGVGVARKGALGPQRIVNCLTAKAFRAFIRKRRVR